MDKTLDHSFEEYAHRPAFRAVELAATLPLIYTVFHNMKKRKTYFEIDATKSQSKTRSNLVEDIRYLYSRFYTETQNLVARYQDAYYKSRLVPRTYFSDGKIKTRLVTEYYWDEETGIPNHNTVENWKNETYPCFDKLNDLKSGTQIDLDKRKNITVVEKEANRTTQLTTNLGVYGTQIGILLGYEEIVALMHKSENQTFKESMRELYSSRQMNRRSMFKGLAALAGAATAMNLDDYLDDRLQEKKSSLASTIQTLESIPQISPEESFKTYFGQTPQEVIYEIKKKTQASNISAENRFVNAAFLQLKNSGERLSEKLEKTLIPVPEKFSEVIKSRLAAEKLENTSTEAEPEINILKEGALSAGVMGILIGLFEWYNVKHK